jgi:hypothetical protein
MSLSHYRGKVFTNDELKGSFQEAKDDFSEAYDLLQREVGQRKEVTIKSTQLGNKLMVFVGGLWVVIRRDGRVEIGESGA